MRFSRHGIFARRDRGPLAGADRRGERREAVREWAAEHVSGVAFRGDDPESVAALRYLFGADPYNGKRLGAALRRWRAHCHGAPPQRLPVRKVGEKHVCLFTDPYGEDYWLRPGERFIVASDDFDAEFEISSMPGYVIIDIMEGSPANVYIIDSVTGERLECGHGRA